MSNERVDEVLHAAVEWAREHGPWQSGNPDHVAGGTVDDDLYNALVRWSRSGRPGLAVAIERCPYCNRDDTSRPVCVSHTGKTRVHRCVECESEWISAMRGPREVHDDPAAVRVEGIDPETGEVRGWAKVHFDSPTAASAVPDSALLEVWDGDEHASVRLPPAHVEYLAQGLSKVAGVLDVLCPKCGCEFRVDAEPRTDGLEDGTAVRLASACRRNGTLAAVASITRRAGMTREQGLAEMVVALEAQYDQLFSAVVHGGYSVPAQPLVVPAERDFADAGRMPAGAGAGEATRPPPADPRVAHGNCAGCGRSVGGMHPYCKTCDPAAYRTGHVPGCIALRDGRAGSSDVGCECGTPCHVCGSYVATRGDTTVCAEGHMRPADMTHADVLEASMYLASECGQCGAEYRGGGDCPRCSAVHE